MTGTGVCAFGDGMLPPGPLSTWIVRCIGVLGIVSAVVLVDESKMMVPSRYMRTKVARHSTRYTCHAVKSPLALPDAAVPPPAGCMATLSTVLAASLSLAKSMAPSVVLLFDCGHSWITGRYPAPASNF